MKGRDTGRGDRCPGPTRGRRRSNNGESMFKTFGQNYAECVWLLSGHATAQMCSYKLADCVGFGSNLD